MGAIEIALLQQLKQQIQGISIPIEAKENISAYSKIYIDQDGKAVNSEAEYNNIVASHTSDFLLSESQTCRNWAWCKIDDTHYARVLRKPGELGHRVQILEFDFTNCSFSIISESSLLTINLNPPNSISDLQQAQIFKVDDGVLLVGLAYGEYDGTAWHYGACVYKITYDASYVLTATKIWSQDGNGTNHPGQGDRLWIFPYDSVYFLLYSTDLSTNTYYMALKKVVDGSEASRTEVSFNAWGGANFTFLSKPELGKFYLYYVGTLYVFTINDGNLSLANTVSATLPSDWTASIRSYPVSIKADDTNNYLAIYCRSRNVGGTLLFSLTDGTQNKANPTFENNLHYVEYNKYSKYCLLDTEGTLYIPFTQDYSSIAKGFYKVSIIKVNYDFDNKKFNSQFICNVDVPAGNLAENSYSVLIANGDDIFVFSEYSIDSGTSYEKLVQVDIDDYFYSKGTCLVALSDINAGETGKAFAKKPVISTPDATAGVTYVENKYIATSTGYLVEIE